MSKRWMILIAVALAAIAVAIVISFDSDRRLPETKPVWEGKADPKMGFVATAAKYESDVVVQQESGLSVLDAKDGALIWSHAFGWDEQVTNVSVLESTIVYSRESELVILDRASGEEVFASKDANSGTDAVSGYSVAANGIFAVECRDKDDCALVAHSVEDGTIRWSEPVDREAHVVDIEHTTAFNMRSLVKEPGFGAVEATTVQVATGEEQVLIDAKTGDELAPVPGDSEKSQTRSMLVDEDLLVTWTTNGGKCDFTMAGISLSEGEEIWAQEVSAATPGEGERDECATSPIRSGNGLLWRDGKGRATVVDPKTGKGLWRGEQQDEAKGVVGDHVIVRDDYGRGDFRSVDMSSKSTNWEWSSPESLEGRNATVGTAAIGSGDEVFAMSYLANDDEAPTVHATLIVDLSTDRSYTAKGAGDLLGIGERWVINGSGQALYEKDGTATVRLFELP